MGKFGKKNVIDLNPLAYNILLAGVGGIGKEQPISEPVLTERGWVQMGDIHVGDKVYGEDGNLHNVTGVYPSAPIVMVFSVSLISSAFVQKTICPDPRFTEAASVTSACVNSEPFHVAPIIDSKLVHKSIPIHLCSASCCPALVER